MPAQYSSLINALDGVIVAQLAMGPCHQKTDQIHQNTLPSISSWSDVTFVLWRQMHSNKFLGSGANCYNQAGFDLARMAHHGALVTNVQMAKLSDWLNYIVLVGTDLPADDSRIVATCLSSVLGAASTPPAWLHRLTFPVGHW
jgi:hypothetical protein